MSGAVARRMDSLNELSASSYFYIILLAQVLVSRWLRLAISRYLGKVGAAATRLTPVNSSYLLKSYVEVYRCE
jgi:hypothetical protein